MSSQRISIAGNSSAGKTLFISSLAHILFNAKSYPRITADKEAGDYAEHVIDAIELGEKPPSTAVAKLKTLLWKWHDKDGDTHEFRSFDCAGQDFSDIFETVDAPLSDTQQKLKEEFFSSKLVLLLLNFQEALDCYNALGKNADRRKISFANAAAIRQLCAKGVIVELILTQADLYRERVAAEWGGDYSKALGDVLPEVFFAMQQTGAQLGVVNVMETELRDGKQLPKKQVHKPQGLEEIIGNIEFFFQQEKQRERAAVELAEQQEDEIRRREVRQKTLKIIRNLLIFAILVTALIFGARCAFAEYEIREKARKEQAEIDKKTNEAALEQAKAKLRIAQAERQLAKQTLDRNEDSFKRTDGQMPSKKEIDNIRLAYRTANENVRIAQSLVNEKSAALGLDLIPIDKEIFIQLENRVALKGNSPHSVALSDSVSLELLSVPAGSFKMGSDDNNAFLDEKPVHEVIISKPFWLGKTEVTQAQWQAIMGDKPSRFQDNGENHPVEQVSWINVTEFCKKLTERERAANRLPAGYEYALPSEAEWEYACRAGSIGDYAGTGKLEDMGWFGESWTRGHHEVGGKQPNQWGFYDMHGNVYEWCSDKDGDYPNGSVTDPQGTETGASRVLRGGSWSNVARNCRAALRRWNVSSYRSSNLGFRLALKPVPSPSR